jgi:hypothetical protein
MRQSNNKILLIVLVVLLSGFVLTRVFRAPSLERNIEEDLLTLDTAQVSAIHITPAVDNEAEIRLVRSGPDWQVQQGGRAAAVEMTQLNSALGSISEIHADRIVTRKKEKWTNYNVDSTGTHVKVFLNQEKQKEFWVGKMSGSGNCIRIEGEDEVYEVEEALDRNFNKNFNAWRDKTFISVQPENVSKIAFQYPGDSSFVVAQSEGKWKIEDAKADSSKVQAYLNRLRSRNLSEFADDFAPSAQPSHILKLSNDSSLAITVQGWKISDDKWVLASSLQDSVYFSSSDATMIRELFAGKKWFLTN